MKTAAGLLATVLALGACSHHKTDRGLDRDTQKKLLIDRNWIDVMPKTERDKLHVYRFVPTMGGGVYQDRTIFKGTFELFKFAVDGDQLEFDLLETHDKVRSQFEITPVDGPEPFDLKLTIPNAPRGPRVYYGSRAETDRAGHLGAREQACAGLLDRVARGAQRRAALRDEARGDRADQAAIGRDMIDECAQPLGARLGGARTRQQLGRARDDRDVSRGQHARDQIVAGREVAIQRADPDAGALRDILQRGVRTVLAARGLRSLDQ